MPCLTFAWAQPVITATDEEKKRAKERLAGSTYCREIITSPKYIQEVYNCIDLAVQICAYFMNAGGMSLFMIWSSVVCTVSFPTWKTQILFLSEHKYKHDFTDKTFEGSEKCM